VLLTAGSIIAFSLIAVGLVRITGNGPDQLAAKVLAERSLRFEDRPDGGVAVIDGQTGLTLDVLQGEQGFVRGALRALSRERRVRGLGSGPAFVLSAHGDGQLRLFDPATGERLDLASFGPTNSGAFARYLPLQPGQAGAKP